MKNVVWIPEAPEHPGLYANEKELNQGKISTGLTISTRSAHLARHFDTEEECLSWCKENPIPKFIPMEHEFIPYVK